MSNISSALASFYTTKTASENTVSDEQVELFTKIAAEQGVDVNALSEEQVSQLWNATFSEGGGEESLKQAADAEFFEKQAMAQDIAKFDALGRIAAHAFAEEAEKIAESTAVLNARRHLEAKEKSPGESLGDFPAAPAAESRFRKALNSVKGFAGKASGFDDIRAARAATEGKGKLYAKGGAKALGTAAAASALGYGTYRAGKAMFGGKKKEASAIDAYAFQEAFDKLAADGWDTDEAAERLNALATLGADDSTKVAYAQDTEQAVDLRAFELIEQAGYPVNWGG